MTARQIFNGSDASQTVQFYGLLNQKGPKGRIATALLRAVKCSYRAKAYRKRAHRDETYARKAWSIRECVKILSEYGTVFGIRYGWKPDPNTKFGGHDSTTSWVLYVELPNGQVSFHDPQRGEGPEYPGEWDGAIGMSVERIIQFCDSILNNT